MTNPAHTDRVIAQGKALVRAIEALSTIEPTGWFERWQMRLLQAAYKQRLRVIVAREDSKYRRVGYQIGSRSVKNQTIAPRRI
jgi:hypothetical protein